MISIEAAPDESFEVTPEGLFIVIGTALAVRERDAWTRQATSMREGQFGAAETARTERLVHMRAVTDFLAAYGIVKTYIDLEPLVPTSNK